MQLRARRLVVRSKRAALGVIAALATGGSAAAGTPLGGPLASPSWQASAAQPALGLRLALGDSRVYRVQATGALDVDYGLLAATVSQGIGEKPTLAASASRRVTAHYDVAATLHWRVVGEEAGGWVLAARLQNVAATVDDVSDPRRALLEAPFVMHVARDGAVRSFDFMRRYPLDLARTIRGLVEPLQVVFPKDAAMAASWDASAPTSGGLSDARYTLAPTGAGDAVHLTKRTTRIYGAPGELGGALPTGAATRVLAADATIALDPAHGTIERVDGREQTMTSAGATFVAAHDGSYHAERVAEPLAALATTAEAATAALADEAFQRARLYDVDARIAPRVEGVALPTMLATFEDELAKNQASAHVLLENYLRRYPAAAMPLARALDQRQGPSDDPVVVIGFAAIAAAGHHEAQTALVDVLSHGGWSARSVERALISLMDLEMPERFVLAAVWSYRTGNPPTDAAASVRQSIATNVYGALGDVKRGNPAITDEVVGVLSALLRTGDARQRVLALDALANVGDYARVAPLAVSSFADPKLAVRVAAFVTFRRMPGELAFSQFALHFAAETDPAVLAEAAIVARDMDASAARNAWARNLSAMTTDRELLMPLVQILGRGLASHPENEDALRGLLATNHDRQVRRDIYAFVAPRAEGGQQ